MTQSVADRFLQLIRTGHGPYSACMEAGISYASFRDEYRKNPEFRARVKEAEKIAVEKVEAQLHEMAVDGNLAAIKFYLTNKRPRKWRERQESGTIAHNHLTVNMGQLARQVAENPDAAKAALEAVARAREPKMLTVEARPNGEV